MTNLALKQLQQLDQDEEKIMQDYIEARGWFYDGDNRWRKNDPAGYTITSLERAYQDELAEETRKLN